MAQQNTTEPDLFKSQIQQTIQISTYEHSDSIDSSQAFGEFL